MSPRERLRWRADHEKSVLLANFERRGWTIAADEDSWPGTSWNLYWASPYSIKQIFSPDNGVRLGDHQVVNHFPNHYELTRKDLMVKNIKRYRKELEKVQAEQRDAGGPTSSAEDLDCVPATFILPADHALLADEFRRSPGSMWIMKPTSKSQGIGIFIVRKWSQVRRWLARRGEDTLPNKDLYVCSRYITNPLLIGGKKFDLRIYVLVLSYRPLKVYVFRRGFARFCTSNYTNDLAELDNELIHLTNVAIQKHSDEYSSGGTHGWKWSLQNLLAYIEGTRGLDAADAMMGSIGWLIVHSLKAVQNVIINDKHCFECYGYDVMLDSDLKPWLIEVNASPSLSTTTTTDRILKTQLISEVMALVFPPNFLEAGRGAGMGSRRPAFAGEESTHQGDFELLYDESAEIEAERVRKELEAARGGRKSNINSRTGPSRATHSPSAFK
mmetsp:Transcript_29534/g.95294  ORF Transcript_29534/g.95294 Transcript_29534/m.95294 type:complete len:442 (-) Transcript_29534:400-1725(-)